MSNNGEDDRPLFEQEEDLQRHVLDEYQGDGQYEDRLQQDDAQEDSSVDGGATTTMPAVQGLAVAVPHEIEINVNRGGDSVHGRVGGVKSPANHHLKLQGHMHNARRRHPHPYAARDVARPLEKRQYSFTILDNNDEEEYTTAPPSELVDPAASIATTTATPHTSDSGGTRDTSIQERGSDYEAGSPPSSPVSRDLIPPIISTITLSNTSPILTTISPTPPATLDTTTTRRNLKVSRSQSPTATTSTRRRRPTSTSSIPSRRRTSRPTPTCTRTRAAPPPPPNNAQITPPSLSSLVTSTPRISNVVHICIVRLPVTEQGGPPPPLVTFTTTAHFPNGIPTIPRRVGAVPPTSTRINTRSREGEGLSDNSRGLGGGDTEDAPALTVTDYHCQLTLPALSRLLHTPTPSLPNPTLSPSDGLNVDDSTLPNSGPAAADPTSGDGTHRDNDDGTAFFATPGGKGTIAGISIASAILLISFVLFFLWRKKKDGGDQYTGHAVGGGDRGSAASSFGDSSNDQLPPLSSDPLSSPPDMAMMDQQPQMQEIGNGTGPPGSFFVQRRSQPSSIRGTSTPPRSNAIDAATAARAMSPLAMLQQRPGAFFAPPAVMTGRQIAPSKEGHTSGSEENGPSTGNSSSHGHGGNDPFRDPSSTGHTTISHDPNIVTAFASGDKHERRRSGYTSDTYRKSKSRSRPLSVRNPDSDETQQGIESLYVDRTPRSTSSDAIYNVDNAQVPDSAGLEYYLGSNAATPRGTTPIPGSTIPPILYPALPPPPPQNTLMDALYMPETPRSTHYPGSSINHQQPPAGRHEHEPGLEYAMPYGGLEEGHPPAATAARLEFEPQMEYTYPQPRAIPSSSGGGSTFARPHLNNSTAHQDPFNPPVPPPVPLIAATIPSNLSRTVDQHNRGASSSGQTRRSTVSSDGASSHSSMWRAWEHSNRSWVNDGFETPNDVQDVQLGSNAGAVGGGNSTSIAGYFSWR